MRGEERLSRLSRRKPFGLRSVKVAEKTEVLGIKVRGSEEKQSNINLLGTVHKPGSMFNV